MPEMESRASTSSSSKVLMEELVGVEVVSASTSTTAALVLKDLLSSIIFGLQLVVREHFVGFTNVVKLLFRFLFVFCKK